MRNGIPSAVTWLIAVVLVYVVQAGIGRGAPSLGLALSGGALPALLVALQPMRWQRRVAVVVILALALVALVQAAYFRFFHRFIPLESLSAVDNAVRHREYVPGLLRASDLAIAVVALGGLALLRWVTRGAPPAGARPRWPLVLVWVVAAVPALRWAWVVSPGDYDSGSGGFLYATMADARRLVGEAMIPRAPRPEEWARVRLLLSARGAPDPGDDVWTGIAAGSNVLMIKVEGLNGWAVTAEAPDGPVAPFVRGLADRGIHFTQVFDVAGEGRSSDADYMVLASQHRARTGAIALARPRLNPSTLALQLQRAGYATFSSDPGRAASWHAEERHRRFGFARSRFGSALGTEIEGLGMPDGLFFGRIAPEVLALPSPTFVWMHTVSTHGPHRTLPPWIAPSPIPAWRGTPLGNYLAKVRYTDSVLATFVSRLEREGALSNTTLVVYGDHTETFEFDRSALAAWQGGGDPGALALQTIPVIIVPPPPVTATRVATVGTLLDLAPTLLHLLGMPQPPSFLGRSLLGGHEGLAVNPSGAVIAHDRYWDGARCWSRVADLARPERDCDAMRAEAARQLEISNLITRYDISRQLDTVPPPRRGVGISAVP